MLKKTSLRAPRRRAQVKNLIPVPFVNQATDYTCGVSAMLSVLCYWDIGEDDYEAGLASELGANAVDGVLSRRIVKFAVSRHFRAVRKVGMTLKELKTHLAKGRPVIVLLQAWRDLRGMPWRNRWGDGHFAVAVGYDEDNVYFMDPSTLGRYTYVPFDEFLERWHDWDGDRKARRLGLVIWKKRRPSFNDQLILRME